ncbi:hypothetical protein ACNKHL_17185 [Shigella flexneri]
MVLFIILNLYILRPCPMGSCLWLLLIGYGAFASLLSFPPARVQFTVRRARHQHGQILSIPTIVAGVIKTVWHIVEPTATRFLRNHETVFRTDAKVLDEGTQKNDRTGTERFPFLVIRCV